MISDAKQTGLRLFFFFFFFLPRACFLVKKLKSKAMPIYTCLQFKSTHNHDNRELKIFKKILR